MHFITRYSKSFCRRELEAQTYGSVNQCSGTGRGWDRWRGNLQGVSQRPAQGWVRSESRVFFGNAWRVAVPKSTCAYHRGEFHRAFLFPWANAWQGKVEASCFVCHVFGLKIKWTIWFQAIYENMLVELPFAAFFLLKLLGKHSTSVDIHHLDSLDPLLYKWVEQPYLDRMGYFYFRISGYHEALRDDGGEDDSTEKSRYLWFLTTRVLWSELVDWWDPSPVWRSDPLK